MLEVDPVALIPYISTCLIDRECEEIQQVWLMTKSLYLPGVAVVQMFGIVCAQPHMFAESMLQRRNLRASGRCHVVVKWVSCYALQ